MRRAAAALAASAAPAAGHGAMTTPPSRNARRLGPGGHTADDDGCPNNACFWFSQGCSIGCPNCTGANDIFDRSVCGGAAPPTVMSPALRTFNRGAAAGSAADWMKHSPWRAPGSAPVFDPCGIAGGARGDNSVAGGIPPPGTARGDRGSALPPVDAPAAWAAGGTAEVAFGMFANHGGGYQYRLCPKSEPLTEACFQRTPLAFAAASVRLRYDNGTELTLAATRTAEGTVPAGSEWAMNPVPSCAAVLAFAPYNTLNCSAPAFAMAGGCREIPDSAPDGSAPGSCWAYSPKVKVVDRVQVPASLPPGDYVVGWRWDCEQNPQVWSSCGDVRVAAAR